MIAFEAEALLDMAMGKGSTLLANKPYNSNTVRSMAVSKV